MTKDVDNMISRDEFHEFLNIDKVLDKQKRRKRRTRAATAVVKAAVVMRTRSGPNWCDWTEASAANSPTHTKTITRQNEKGISPPDKTGKGVISTKQFKNALDNCRRISRSALIQVRNLIDCQSLQTGRYGKSEVKYKLFLRLCAGKYKKVSTKKRSVGDRVSAKCAGWTRYFEGEITKVNRDGTYAIKFDDGERQKSVTEDQIKGELVDSDDSDSDDRAGGRGKKSSSRSRDRKRRVGDRVSAKCSGWTKYFEGEITKVNSDGTYAILFDDGEEEEYVSEDEIKGRPGGDDSDDDYDRRRDDKRSSRSRDRKQPCWGSCLPSAQAGPSTLRARSRVNSDGRAFCLTGEKKKCLRGRNQEDLAEMTQMMTMTGAATTNGLRGVVIESAALGIASAKCSGWTKYFEGEITKVNRWTTPSFCLTTERKKKYVSE